MWIDRIYDKQNGQGSIYFFEDASAVNYQIDFEGDESLVLAANKSVLLEKNGQKRKSSCYGYECKLIFWVLAMKIGDKIPVDLVTQAYK